MSLQQFDSKKLVQIFFILLLKTIYRHWNCFLSSVAPDGKDGHLLKLEKR